MLDARWLNIPESRIRICGDGGSCHSRRMAPTKPRRQGRRQRTRRNPVLFERQPDVIEARTGISRLKANPDDADKAETATDESSAVKT